MRLTIWAVAVLLIAIAIVTVIVGVNVYQPVWAVLLFK